MKIEISRQAVKRPCHIAVGGQQMYLTKDELYHLGEMIVGMGEIIKSDNYLEYEQQELLTEYPTSCNGWDLEV